jgi:ATP sulfurylase
MKLTIEMSPQDAVTLLKGLDVTEVVINSTQSTVEAVTPKTRAKRKPKIKQLEKEVNVIATAAVEVLDEKINSTYTNASKEQDTTGEAFAVMDSPWKT